VNLEFLQGQQYLEY